jgi:hypothetical protein
MKFTTLIAALAIATLAGCSAHQVPDIKQHANEMFEKAGFKVVGYEGFQYGSILSPGFGGRVWYILERNKVTYEAYIAKWGDEYHIYGLQAKDAIAPNQ